MVNGRMVQYGAMKTIFEEYGDVILQVLGGIAVVVIIIDLFRSNGVLRELFVKLIENAC